MSAGSELLRGIGRNAEADALEQRRARPRNGKPATPEPKRDALAPAAARKPEPAKPARPSAPSYEPFPVAALPEPVSGFVGAAAKAIGCDPAYVALPLLSALAAAIGNSRTIRLKRGWVEPAVVWSAIVGESGTLKSPALDAPLKPIRNRQEKSLREYQKVLTDYDQAKEVYDIRMREWKRKGQNKGEPAPTRPDPPICERFWVSDVTVEALAPRLRDAPRGLLLCCDELAGWIGGFGQYKGGRGQDSAHFLTMHGARSLLVDRKTGDMTTIYVPRAALSICGGIQPEILRQALAREHFESGLAARLLLAMPPPRTKRWSEVEIDPELEAALANIFDRLYGLSMLVNPVTGESTPIAIPLSRDGKTQWVRFYNEHAQEMAELTGDLASAWSKLEGYAARLALIIHLTRFAANDPSLPDPDHVDAASIEVGAKLSQWFGQEARRVYAVLGETEQDRDKRRLLEMIQAKGGTITVRQLQQSDRRFRGSADAADAALGDLVNWAYGTWEFAGPKEHGGRPTRVFRLHPVYAVNGTETSENQAENDSSVDVDSVDTSQCTNDERVYEGEI